MPAGRSASMSTRRYVCSVMSESLVAVMPRESRLGLRAKRAGLSLLGSMYTPVAPRSKPHLLW